MTCFLKSRRLISAFIAIASFIFSSYTVAGAFQLWEEDVSGIGDYHAGAAAEGNTAGSEFYNPASIILLKRQQISFGGAMIDVDVNYTGTAQSELGTVYMNAVSGGTTNFVPNIHYVTPLPDHFAFALGVTTPFGLSTNYPDLSPVNVIATKTQLTGVNINPSIAYEIDQHVALAVGFDEMYGQAVYDGNTFTNYTSRMDGWNAGYNAGALFQITPQTRVGLSYRSAITIAAWGASHSSTYLTRIPINSEAHASLTLPPTSIASLYHAFNSRFSLMASAFYTQWSDFNSLIIKSLATAGGPTSLTVHENYQNTWNLALGGKYHLSKIYVVEAGFGHDETPTVYGYRDIRLPDSNRWAASLGFDIHPTEGFWVTMGWTHFFIPTVSIDNTQSTSAPIATAVGTATGSINVFGVQLSVDV